MMDLKFETEPVFELSENGMLYQVSRESVGKRRFHRIQLMVDVLFTAEEEKARDEEEAQEAQKVAQTPQVNVEEKLAALGITVEELRKLLK